MFNKKYIVRLLLLTASILLLFIFWKGLANIGLGYDWSWNRVWRYFGSFGTHGFIAGPLLTGIFYTLAITALGLLVSLASGLLAAASRLSPWLFCIFSAKIYVMLWRNTPLLLQLFIAYFLLSPLLGLSPFWTAILALGLFEGAYFAEIFRGGILGVHKNQWEAALSLGFSLWQAFILVILPQAARNVLPSLVNQGVSLLKDSTLVSAIAVADLTMQSQAIVSETFLAFEIWLLAGAIYLILAFLISIPGLLLEKRNSIKGNMA